jgi:hypothetical protein
MAYVGGQLYNKHNRIFEQTQARPIRFHRPVVPPESIGRRRAALARLCPPCFLGIVRTACTHTEADTRTHTHAHTRGCALRHATRTLMNPNTQHTRRSSLTHRRASICAAPSHSRCWAAGSLGRLPMGRIVMGWAAESIRGRLRVARQDGARTRREQTVRSRVLTYCWRPKPHASAGSGCTAASGRHWCARGAACGL